MSRQENRNHIIKHIDRKLLIRIRIFLVIFLATFIIGIVDSIVYHVTPLFLASALIIGFGLGLLSGRIQKITFDHDAYKVISRMDRLGVAILVIYIGVAILRKKLIGDRVHGPAVTIVTLGVVAGTMAGRAASMRYAIVNILKSIGIIK